MNFPYFVYYNNQFSILFVHYVDHIYPNLCITLTNFPQSMNNTVFCGIQFQISPNLIYFRNYLQWPKRFPRVSFRGYARNDKRLIHTNSTHEHDNRIIPDYIVGNNQQMLIFANITINWCFWRVFTCAVGTKKQICLEIRTQRIKNGVQHTVSGIKTTAYLHVTLHGYRFPVVNHSVEHLKFSAFILFNSCKALCPSVFGVVTWV